VPHFLGFCYNFGVLLPGNPGVPAFFMGLKNASIFSNKNLVQGHFEHFYQQKPGI
jgi:hypothetical protein